MTETVQHCPAFCGPDDLASTVLAERQKAQEEKALFGDLSESNLRRLMQIIYLASQVANEGRLPQFTVLVPAAGEDVLPFIALADDLTVDLLRRLGPALTSQDHALVVSEQDGKLHISGIVPARGFLTDLTFGDPTSRPTPQPKGLLVEVYGPGDLRTVEHQTWRLQAGQLRQEVSFFFADWFKNWYQEAATYLFETTARTDPARAGWTVRPDYAIAGAWYRLLQLARDLHHGASFAILREPDRAPLRPAFRPSNCDLGAVLADAVKAARTYGITAHGGVSLEEANKRVRLRERILSAVDAVAQLSATDGCVVFNRRLQLHSFGAMIEPTEAAKGIRCFEGKSQQPLDGQKWRSFGARRRSAIQLCQECLGAVVFVISQDGELRIFFRDEDGVRFYDNAAYW